MVSSGSGAATAVAAHDSFSLANGLRVVVLPAAGDSRAAALLQVAAGSHDEPASHPGLAHFLEHLLFLGGERRLMPFVQACGGRVNASTQARFTDYFFEVPADRLGDGLERLVDMLAHPRFEPALLRSELDVLDAEYRARAGDLPTLCEAALVQGVAGAHPLSAFHAGHRSSLALEDGTCLRALRSFHADFYRAGQMTLVLHGPQPLDELRRLAEHLGGRLAAGVGPAGRVPPALTPLREHSLKLELPAGVPRLWLGFALEQQAPALAQAIELLGELIADEAPGSLQAGLLERGLADGVALRPLYRHAGQALLVLDVQLAGDQTLDRALIEAALFDWLAWLAALPAESALLAGHGHGHRRRRRWQALAPLERVRAWLHGALAAPLDAATLTAWRRLLGQLQPARLIRLYASPAVHGTACNGAGFPLRLASDAPPSFVELKGEWQLPAECEAAATEEEGAVLLRWRLPGMPDEGQTLVLQRVLRPLAGLARHAGGELRFSAEGIDWLLTLRAPAPQLPALLDSALRRLGDPPASLRAQAERLAQREAERRAGELPIRQLLQALPGWLATTTVTGGVTAAGLTTASRHARWVGLDSTRQAEVQALLALAPGVASEPRPPVALAAGRQYRLLPTPGTEVALLLFCPLPSRAAGDEAAWRLLARCLEAPFHQRLRGELQLGYALFCGFREVAGQGGVLFAVQSPNASASALLSHLEAFLAAQQTALTDLDPAVLAATRAALVDGLQAAPATLDAEIERQWRLLLGAHPGDWDARVADAAARLAGGDLLAALTQLREGGWWLLANQSLE